MKLFTSILTGLLLVCGSANAKSLTVYFSVSGNTERLANVVHENVGGDIVKIIPVNPYPVDDYHNKSFTDLAQKEKSENARPEIMDINVNMDEYDTIYVGYPIWWGDMPMIVYNFLEKHTFNGQNLYPFCTHEGSGESGTFTTVGNLAVGAMRQEGLAIEGKLARQDGGKKQAEYFADQAAI